MKRAMAIWMLPLCVAISATPGPALAGEGSPATHLSSQSAAAQLASQLIGRMVWLLARQYAEGRLDTVLDRDAESARLLPAGSPARVAFLDEAVRRTQRIAETYVRPLMPAIISALDANMTAPQISASARVFETQTGKRILDRVVSEILLSQEDDSSEMTDAEVESLISLADAPALIAFEKSGAPQAMEKAMDALPEQEEDIASILESDVDALLGRMLAALNTPGEATVADPFRPVL